MKKTLLLGFWVLSCTNFGHSQTHKASFEAVYVSNNRENILALKDSSGGYSGYLIKKDEVLKLRGVQLADGLIITTNKGTAVASLDNEGNIMIVDDAFNSINFYRTATKVMDIINIIENKSTTSNTPVMPADTTPKVMENSKPRTPRGVISEKYAGRKFTKQVTGYSSAPYYSLYPDGTFISSTGAMSGYMVQTPDGYYSHQDVSSQNDGQWSIITKNGTEYLLLDWKQGEQGEMEITQDEEKHWYLNGTRWFLTPIEN